MPVLSATVALKGKRVKVHTLDIAPLRSESPPQKRSSMARVLKGFHSFTCTPTRSSAIGMNNLPLPSQPQLVLIYRPRRDGRLSKPWCEVAQAEIRTRNLPIANPALYHTATRAPALIQLQTLTIILPAFSLFRWASQDSLEEFKLDFFTSWMRLMTAHQQRLCTESVSVPPVPNL